MPRIRRKLFYRDQKLGELTEISPRNMKIKLKSRFESVVV